MLNRKHSVRNDVGSSRGVLDSGIGGVVTAENQNLSPGNEWADTGESVRGCSGSTMRECSQRLKEK